MFANSLMAASRRRRISLTALIDVVFILLMFFMLSSTFTQWRAVDVLAPVAGDPATASEPPQLMILSAAGELTLPGTEWRAASLDALDQANWSSFSPEKPVVLLPEADVTVQTIVTAMEKLALQPSLRIILGGALPGAEPAQAGNRHE